MTSHSFLLRPLAALLLTGVASIAFAQTQNTITQYQYDANGNLKQITDPLGRITNHNYDALNRLKQHVQPAPTTGAARPIIQYGYDGQDQLTTVVDPRNLVTGYTVDGLGNQAQLTSPDTGTTIKTYDVAGNLKTSKDARGLTTTYSYDALNRLTTIAYASGTATTFQYDGGTSGAPNAKGKLTRITDESGQTTYSYDGFGRLAGKTQTVGTGTTAKSFTVTYTYHSNDQTTSITYPSSNRINLGYDTAGRLNSIKLNPTNANGIGTNTGSTINLLTGIGYAPFGAPKAWTWGNSSGTSVNTTARSFDLDGRMTRYVLGHALNNGTTRTVTYDPASRITVTTHTGSGTGVNLPANLNQTYGYDNLDRLTSLTAASTSQGFQYDASGNRTQATFGANAYTNTIDTFSNKLKTTAGPTPAKTNVFDADGNLTSDGTFTYTYSARGRMATSRSGVNTVTYWYNGLDQRVRKTGPTGIIATGTHYYVYDEQGQLLGQYDANGKVVQETVFLNDLPVGVLKQTVTGIAPNQVTATQIYYVHADHINTPRVITRATDNKMVWRWDNADPFGMFKPNENPASLGTFTYDPRFPGQVFDKESNLHYNYYRDYDPSIGRYVQSDPIGLKGGINTYTYVLGNPLRYTDARGLDNPSMGPYGPNDPPPAEQPNATPGLGYVCIECLIPFSRLARMIAEMCQKESAALSKGEPPSIPPGMTQGSFGKDLIGWGSGPAGTVQRTSNITRPEVEAMAQQGLTRNMAQQWRDFYANEFARNPNNLTAQARIDLMKKIDDMLKNCGCK